MTLSRRLDRLEGGLARDLRDLPDETLERLVAPLPAETRAVVRGLPDVDLRALAAGDIGRIDPGTRRALGLVAL